MNRLVSVYTLHRPAVCPICNDSLRSEVLRIYNGVAICAMCDAVPELLGLDALIDAVRGTAHPGWWSSSMGVLFLTPPEGMLSAVGYACQARCGTIPDLRVHVVGDGDGI